MTRLLDQYGDPILADAIAQTCQGDLKPLAPPADPLAMIAQAVAKGVDPEQLSKLMDLYERVESRRALDAFNQAMSAAQGEMPAIPKTETNSHTKSMYASWEGMNHLIRPVYSRHGFSLMFGEIVENDKPELLHLYVDVAHTAGHTKRFEGLFPRDGTGIKGNSNMTQLQGVGSTRSYAKRYLAKDVFCLAEGGEDNDGELIDTLIRDEQDEIERLLQQSGADRARFLAWLNYPDVQSILRKDFSKAVYELNRKAGRK